MSAPFTREDMVDAIATAISDSMDVGWTSRTGAEAVVRNCGIFELYEELQQFVNGVETRMIDSPADETLANITRRAKAALAKVRGG